MSGWDIQDDKTSEGARGGSTYAGRNFRVVGAPFIKKDAKALVTGKPVFTDDLALKECLVVKVLRSPYAHAMVREIDCGVAAKIPGIECILTWKDVPQSRFTMAGQTYPEPSPMTGSYWTAGCVSRETRWQSWQERTRQRWIMPCASYV
ncbi:MAG: hypothetical protein ACLR0U_29185 [Enterocloster clostridioformis]